MNGGFSWSRGEAVRIGQHYGLRLSKSKAPLLVFSGRFANSQRPVDLSDRLGQRLRIWGLVEKSGIYFSRLEELAPDQVIPPQRQVRKRCQAAVPELVKQLKDVSGLVAVGYGLRQRFGASEPSYCLKVQIHSKKQRVRPLIPKVFKGLTVDVVEGRAHSGVSCLPGPRKLRKTSKLLCGGLQIGAYGSPDLATLGTLVRRQGRSQPFALTVSHLYNGLINFSAAGPKTSTVETHQGRIVDLPFGPSAKTFIGDEVITSRSADVALIDVGAAKREFRNHLYGHPNQRIRSFRKRPKVPINVRKLGAFTGPTEGRVVEFYKHGYIIESIRFERLYVVKSRYTDRCVAAQGDSGAIFLDDEDRAVGLLVGVDEDVGDRAYMVDFEYVFDALNESLKPWS